MTAKDDLDPRDPGPSRTGSTVAALAADGLHELVSDMRLVSMGAPLETFALAGRATLGSSELATVRLSDSTVSRLHADITIVNGRARLRDLGSRNGTFVDGVSVVEAHLHDGATVRLGAQELRFEVGTQHHRVALSRADHFGGMSGRSTAMRRVFAQLEQAAPTDATVLLIGETGTGKEVAADAIRDGSDRREKPFVVVDCGATPAQLLEAELFGHEKGAFTSAAHARVGAFEAANGGTVFLDEIGELPLELQPKLLRVLSKREIKRIGRNEYQPVDVRVIAATNRDLLDEVDRKAFRSDLYYRLAVVEVRLPPLRERTDDLDLLVKAIVEDMRVTADVKVRLTSPEAIRRMSRHPWPGNVRELRNFLERSAVNGVLEMPSEVRSSVKAAGTTDRAGPFIDLSQPYRAARDGWVSEFERRYLEGLLEAHNGNVRAVAAAAGIDRVYLYRILWRHGLKRPAE